MPDFSDEEELSVRAKTDLRHAVLARRRSLPPERRAAAAGRVQAELTELVRRIRPRNMAAYVPVGSEPGGADLPEVLRSVLAPEVDLLLPVLRPDLDLDWAGYAGPETLRAAGYGMREPVDERRGVAAIGSAQLIVVPALAVDLAGTRLGRGGGSYDRALSRVSPGALTVALLYDDELIDVVPARPHDQPVHGVITPAGGLRMLTAS